MNKRPVIITFQVQNELWCKACYDENERTLKIDMVYSFGECIELKRKELDRNLSIEERIQLRKDFYNTQQDLHHLRYSIVPSVSEAERIINNLQKANQNYPDGYHYLN